MVAGCPPVGTVYLVAGIAGRQQTEVAGSVKGSDANLPAAITSRACRVDDANAEGVQFATCTSAFAALDDCPPTSADADVDAI